MLCRFYAGLKYRAANASMFPTITCPTWKVCVLLYNATVASGGGLEPAAAMQQGLRHSELELVADGVEACFGAFLVLVAARRAGDANRAEERAACFDDDAALQRDDVRQRGEAR